MYAKIFTQIFDSSIADNWKTRHVFEDMLKLADIDGVVDMTHEAISARTRVPITMVRSAISELEAPDPRSRSKDADGRRIELLDDHRDWGWHIINYEKFRETATDCQRREKTRDRVARFKAKRKAGNAPVTHGNAPVTPKKQAEAEAEVKAKAEAEAEELPFNPPPGESVAQKALEASAKANEAEDKAQGGRRREATIPKSVFDAWNIIDGIQRCLDFSEKRKRKLAQRLREAFFSENWTLALSRIGQSNFCKGAGDRAWKANFDWFIRPDTCARVMEGGYDDQQQGSVKPHEAAMMDAEEMMRRARG